jgi:hypothetical protein
MAKSSKGSKNGIVIKANLESFRILEIGQSEVRSEMNNKGTITGKYSGMHWDTVESQMNVDGTSSWQVKFIQMTNKGDMLVGTGSGTGAAPDSKGNTVLSGEGTLMTMSQRLADLNGKRWTCTVRSNMATGKATMSVEFH